VVVLGEGLKQINEETRKSFNLAVRDILISSKMK
jgi:hypothetical protein